MSKRNREKEQRGRVQVGARHTDADLFHQWEEAEERAEKWEKTAREERKQHEWAISDVRAELRREMAEMRKELTGKIEEVSEENEALKRENEMLREDNERLKSIINNDSNNSSKPPSSDQKPNKRANEYNGRKRSGKKRGGQTGHKGRALSKEDAEELIRSGKVKHEVIDVNRGKGRAKYISRYEYDIETRTVVREYRYYEDEAGKCHIPTEQRTAVRYGDGLRTMAVALYDIGVMSIERIREMLNAMSGNVLRISDGAVYKFIRGFSEAIEPDLKAIETDLANQKVVQTDATVVTLNGAQSYIRNFSTSKSVLYVGMDRKNLEHMKKVPFLSRFTGTLVHDHETALYHFGTGHGECNVHVMRYLTKNSEDTGNTWSGEMKKLLSEMNRERKKLIAQGSIFSDDQIADYEARYTQIIYTGRQQNTTTRPKWARKDELALLNRMEKYSENHLLFLHRIDVPFDNNMSERDLRKCKNRQKISGGFGIAQGRNMACRILSFVETCKRRSLNVFVSINLAFHRPALLDR